MKLAPVLSVLAVTALSISSASAAIDVTNVTDALTEGKTAGIAIALGVAGLVWTIRAMYLAFKSR